jgi:hypothetical protein
MEVSITPTDETTNTRPDVNRIDIAIQTLTGSVPCTDISLSNFREERLRKYEITD